jgi:nitrogen fixation protein FixH
MTNESKKSGRRTGWQWPAGIVAFFVLLAAINAWVVYLGITRSGSLVEEGAYEKGLNYQQNYRKTYHGRSTWVDGHTGSYRYQTR